LEEREAYWLQLAEQYSTGLIDYSGLEKYRPNEWQRQLHLFEVPFYYIEYGIAQLGAIGLWMQFKENPQQALENYMQALSLGGTRTLPELYKAAGLTFDFSSGHIKTLMHFVQQEMEKLEG
jgi:oligoendopeptidase F